MALNPNSHRLGLASGFDGGVGGVPPVAAAATEPPRKETLTQKFNRHASLCPSGMPASKAQIEALKDLLSQPRPGFHFSPKGTATNSYNPEHDRKIMKQIEALQQSLDKVKGKAKGQFKEAAQHKAVKHEVKRGNGWGV